MKTLKSGVLGIMAAVLSGFFVLSILSLGLTEGMISIPSTRTLQATLPLPNLTPIPVILVTSTAFPTETFPPAPTQCPPPAGWQPYLVQPGDTLAGLAAAHGITLKILMNQNCLISSQVVADTLIYLPVLLTATVQIVPQLTATNQPTKPGTATTCSHPQGWISYTVKPGDTLTRISVLFRISILQLKQANCLVGDNIRVGSQLWVPNVATSTFTPSPSPTATQVPPTPKPTSTSTKTTTPTNTTEPTATNTTEPTATSTLEPTATNTPEPPTPTATTTMTATNTPEIPTLPPPTIFSEIQV